MYLMKPTNFISILTVLGILQMVTELEARLDTGRCEDNANWCRKLGRKIPLSRCYDPRHKARCCETCERLRLPLPECEYGDRDPSLCHSIDKTRPVGDCYAFNRTCCQTCHIYDSGIPDCPFGDRVTWCSGIGERYLVSSCYDHEIHCCDTCRQFRTGIPGDENPDTTRCPYGDRLLWCSGIGDLYPISYCEQYAEACCESCNRFRDIHKSPATTQGARSTLLKQTFPTPMATEGSKTRSNSITDSHLTNVTEPWKPSLHPYPPQTLNTTPAVPIINTVLTDTSLWQPSPQPSNESVVEVSESGINSTNTRVTSQVPLRGGNKNNNDKDMSGREKSAKSDSDIEESTFPGSPRGNSGLFNNSMASPHPSHNYSSTDTAEKANKTVTTPSGRRIYDTAESSDTTSDSPVNDIPLYNGRANLTEISPGKETKKPISNESISQGVSSGCRILHSGPPRDYLLLVVISLSYYCYMAQKHFYQIDHKLPR